MSFELYKLLITIVVLHELSHAFTKHYFHGMCTPLGVGTSRQGPWGESGWLVEEMLFEGRLAAEWDDSGEKGQMGKISRVVLGSDFDYWAIGKLFN